MEGTGQSAFDQIRSLAQEVSEREGCMLYDLEIIGQGQGRIVRVYIDKYSPMIEASTEANALVEGAGQGASIDDCVNVSRGLGLLLDVEDIIGSAYELEVSTPGLERVLKETWHFEKALGKTIQVTTNEPIEALLKAGARKAPKAIVGKLVQVTESLIKININESDEGIDIQRPSIHKAKVKFVFESTKPKKNPSKTKKRKSKR